MLLGDRTLHGARGSKAVRRTDRGLLSLCLVLLELVSGTLINDKTQQEVFEATDCGADPEELEAWLDATVE